MCDGDGDGGGDDDGDGDGNGGDYDVYKSITVQCILSLYVFKLP